MSVPLPDILIRASAGTGKTYQLASRFLQLLDRDVPPESILAATFTRKAAGEILERILLTLARAARDDDKRALLAVAIESPKLSAERCRQLLSQLVRRLHRLQVGTLDSFFAKLASSFALELGLPPGWSILDDADLKQLRQDAVEALLEAADDDELVRLLRLLTKGTASRSINDLILDTVNDCHEVALETPASAWQAVPCPPHPSAAELAQSVDELRDLIATAEKTFQKPMQGDIDLAEREQWEEMLKKGILAKLIEGETKYSRKELDPQTLAVYRRLLARLSAVALHRLSQQTEATRELLDKYDHELRELQQRQGGCSFSDVARALANRRKAANEAATSLGELTFRLDSRLSHLLLDEFQDTSPLQWKVLRPFAEQVVRKPAETIRSVGEGVDTPATHDPSPTLRVTSSLPTSFFCVGDVKQAIYGWRGGDARIFETMQRQLPHLTSRDLDKSWRSATPIIETVNRVFQNLRKHPKLEKLADPVASWCRNYFRPHSTAKTKLRGFVQLRTVSKCAEGESQGDDTLKAAAQLVAELAAKHPDRNIGVLTRSNEAVAQLIFELHHLGVPASEEGGHPLIDSAAVRLLLSLLKLADHPGDTIARFHLAMSPLGPRFEFVDHRDDVAAARLAESLRRELLSHGYGPSLARWAKFLDGVATPRDQARLTQLVKLADAYQPAATLRPNDFAEFVREERVADPSGDRIRVMTVHQAKGLEFDIVVLPELDKPIPGQPPALVSGNVDATQPPNAVCLYRDESIQRLLPDDLQQLFEKDLELRTHESLCLLYVALTRAIHAMFLLIAPHDKDPLKSYSGLLRASLTDDMAAPADAVLFETGDADWDSPSRMGTPARPGSGKSAQPTTGIRFAPPLPTPIRGLQRESPSAREARPSQRLGELLQAQPTQARDRGTVIHKWFEQIEWLDDGGPSGEQLLAAARTLPPMTFDPLQVLVEFRSLLAQPTIVAVLSHEQSPHRSLTPRVFREYRFACRFEQTLLSGAIDRLVLWSSADQVVAAEVFDFKTDAVPDQPSLAAKVETYRPQLDSYRSAVAQLFGLSPQQITANLVFVQHGDVVTV
jgi:ATP-dependent exoDNAse (exonuclease V) beta subunit